MKKTLLVTLFGNFNYGNRLQNYALQEVLKSMGFEVHNLCAVSDSKLYTSYISTKLSEKIPKLSKNINKYIYSILRCVKWLIKCVLVIVGLKKYQKYILWDPLRRKRFSIFTNAYIDNKIYSTYEDCLISYALHRANFDETHDTTWSMYDYAIVGSDQVWHNWSHTTQELDFFYLSFIEPYKRIAYAPSFGFTEFPNEDYEVHRRGLSSFRYLSCREQDGCDLIEKMIGRKAKLVLDPTLLLTSEQWLSLEKKPFYRLPEHFILVYILGNKTQEYEQTLEQIANEKIIIDVHSMKQRLHYLTDPNEFLWLVHHTDFVCTDSFHATAFSIIFQKDFLVFRRQEEDMMDMFGRIETLLSGLDLLDRVYGNSKTNDITRAIDYDHVYEKLQKLKHESLQYLLGCFE